MDTYEQIKQLYEQVLSVSVEISGLVSRFNFDDAVLREKYKANLIKKINIAKKTLKFSDSQRAVLSEIIEQIKRQELQNMQNIEKTKDEASKYLKKTASHQKIYSKYNSAESDNSEGLLFDINDDV